MLSAIAQTTLLDDVWRSDPTTNRLEALAASLFGHEAGLLVLSGTMGNQLALRSHLGAPPHSVVADARSHVLGWEAGGLASLCGAFPLPVAPSQGREHLVLDDVQSAAVLDDDVHHAPTRLVSLENTLHGAVLPLADCEEIGAWARAHGVITHLDGARLWEAVAAQTAHGEHDGSLAAGLRAYGRCVDSVTVCFSKGLGAPLGSVLVGSESFIKRARHVRKSLGGGMRQTGVIAAPALVAVRETFFGGQLLRAHELARRVGRLWEEKGGTLIRPVETNMVWLDLKGKMEGEGKKMQARLNLEAQRHGIQVRADPVCRIVCHYQISDEAVERLGNILQDMLDSTEDIREPNGDYCGKSSAPNVNGSTNQSQGEAFKGYG